MNKILTVVALSVGIASAINMNKDSYYRPVELAQKKSSVNSEETSKAQFFILDDVFNFFYCTIYPNCYGRVE